MWPPTLVFGFGTAVAMWCAWVLTHLPGLSAPPIVGGVLLLVLLLGGAMAAGSRTRGCPAWLVGLGAGLTTAFINLLILGSIIARPPTQDGKPAPGWEGLDAHALSTAVPGFLGVSALVGLIGAVLGRSRSGHGADQSGRWLARFTVVNAVAIVPLLLLGGAVTSTSSGMAVNGWPDSYGANMFLFPISLMSNPRIFLEHTHRLFGSLVGLTTLTTMVWVLIAERRAWVRAWAVGVFVLVCVQGVLGGMRVVQINPYLGALHGVAAQLFFAAAVALAAYCSSSYVGVSGADAGPNDRKIKVFATGLLHATILQLIFGALHRHVGQEKGTMHALWAHAAFSLVVVVFAVLAGFSLRARAGASGVSAWLRRIGRGLVEAVGAQFLLGWAAFFLVLRQGARGPAPRAHELASAKPVDTLTAVVATLHHANGALILALATLSVVLIRRVWKARTAAGAPTDPPTTTPASA